MNLRIREFLETPEDFASVVEIDNACDPEHPSTMKEFRYNYEHFDRKRYVLRYYLGGKNRENRGLRLLPPYAPSV